MVRSSPMHSLKGMPSTSSKSEVRSLTSKFFILYRSLTRYSNALRALMALMSGLLTWFSSHAEQRRCRSCKPRVLM